MGSIVPYVSLLISVLATIVSYYCFLLNRQRAIQPMLVFSQDVDQKGASEWHVENVGSGPAINVVIAAGDRDLKWNEKTALRLPALGARSKFELSWIPCAESLFAAYADAEGRFYTTTCIDSSNRIKKQKQFPAIRPTMFAYQLKKK